MTGTERRDLLRYEEPPPLVDLTEAAWEWPGEFKVQVTDRLAGLAWHRYPARHQHAIQQAVGEFLGVPDRCVLLTRGASEALRIAFSKLCPPTGRLLLPRQSFFGFRLIAELLGREYVWYRPTDLGFAPDRLGSAAPPLPVSAMVVCTPDNPTGVYRSADDLLELADAVYPVPVIADLTYDWFSGRAALSALSALVSAGIVGCVSFSKAFAIAGVRLGALIADPDRYPGLHGHTDRFPLDLFQLAVLEVLLTPRWRNWSADRIAETLQLKQNMVTTLNRVCPGSVIRPGGGNYLPVRRSVLSAAGLLPELEEHTPCKVFTGMDLTRITVNERAAAAVCALDRHAEPDRRAVPAGLHIEVTEPSGQPEAPAGGRAGRRREPAAEPIRRNTGALVGNLADEPAFLPEHPQLADSTTVPDGVRDDLAHRQHVAIQGAVSQPGLLRAVGEPAANHRYAALIERLRDQQQTEANPAGSARPRGCEPVS